MKAKSRLYLTDLFFLLLIAQQTLGIFALAFPGMGWLYAFSWLVILAVLFLDYRSLPGKGEVSGKVSTERAPALGEEATFKIALSVPDSSWNFKRMRLSLPSLRNLELLRGELTASLVADFKFRAKSLGFEQLGELELSIESARGLFFRQVAVPIDPFEFRVIPSRKEITEVSFQQIVQQQRIFSSGVRKVARSRSAEQLHSIRKYHYPDPMRHIDAKKTAKLQQLMTRTYESLLSHHLVLALDLGRTMKGKVGNSMKMDFYLSACLSLASSAVRARDRVSLIAFCQGSHFIVNSARDMKPFEPLYKGSPLFNPRDQETDFDSLVPSLSQIAGQRALVLLFTDISRASVQDSVLQILPSVSRRNLVATISLVDEAYSLTAGLDSIETKKTIDAAEYSRLLYSTWLERKIRLFRNEMAKFGGGAISVSERDWSSAVHKAYDLMRRSEFA